MRKKRKPFYKSLRFWLILITALVVAGLCVAIAAELWGNGGNGKKDHGIFHHGQQEQQTFPPPETNPYEPLDFYYEDGYLTCGAGKSTLGIDVSYWQGEIDWQQVKDAGIEFVIIRAGYRGTGEGTLEADSTANANYEGAKAAGLKVGAYMFSQAITVEEAVEEAEFIMDLVKDWELDMPIVYDWEYINETARTANMDARTLTDCTKAFCQTVREAGYDTMIYFNADQSHKQMYLSELTEYGFWLAMYEPVMDYPYKIDMWQYTNQGTVPGIQGNVDINLLLHY